MDLGLKGKTALITGASRGIGRAVAETMAEEGVELHLTATNKGLLDELAADIEKRFGATSHVHPLDLSDGANQKSLVEVAGDVDILVNNAGAIPGGGITEVDEATWRRSWDLKVFGYVNMIRMIYPRMVKRRSGVIVNVVGQAGNEALPDYVAGVAGNASLIALSAALGRNSPRFGVRVVSVNPAATLTDRLVGLWKKRAAQEFGDPEKWRDYTERQPFGRAGEAHEVADMVTFLASDRASFVSGIGVTMGFSPLYQTYEFEAED